MTPTDLPPVDHKCTPSHRIVKTATVTSLSTASCNLPVDKESEFDCRICISTFYRLSFFRLLARFPVFLGFEDGGL